MESFWHKLPEFWPQSSVWIQPKSCLVSIISFAATTLLHRVLLQCFRHALCLNFSAVLSFLSCGDFKLPAPLLLLLLELLLLLRWLHIAELTHPRDETGNTKCRLERKMYKSKYSWFICCVLIFIVNNNIHRPAWDGCRDLNQLDTALSKG